MFADWYKARAISSVLRALPAVIMGSPPVVRASHHVLDDDLMVSKLKSAVHGPRYGLIHSPACGSTHHRVDRRELPFSSLAWLRC